MICPNSPKAVQPLLSIEICIRKSFASEETLHHSHCYSRMLLNHNPLLPCGGMSLSPWMKYSNTTEASVQKSLGLVLKGKPCPGILSYSRGWGTLPITSTKSIWASRVWEKMSAVASKVTSFPPPYPHYKTLVWRCVLLLNWNHTNQEQTREAGSVIT